MKLKKFGFMLLMMFLLVSCAQPNDPAENESALKIYNTIETEGYAFDFAVSDELLFIAEDQCGFSIYNFVSGSMYCHIDSLNDGTLYENVRKIAGSADKNVMIVYDRYGEHARFDVFNISDLINPLFLISNISNTSDVQKIVTSKNSDNNAQFTWTSANSFSIASYDENWSNEVAVDFANSVGGFDFNDEIAVIAAEQSGLHFVDLATEETLLTYDTIGEALDVKLVDNYAFVALRQEGFMILDITDPVHPVEIHQEDVGEIIYTIDVKDNFMLLSSHSGGVMLYDISDLTEPELAGRLSDNKIGYTYKAAFAGDYIVASTRVGVVIIEY
ncbi:MAG TPA: hypothetical protein PLD62_02530 [Candidatus Cloacimonadota bacterium]|nr:hypothetical protein [Candidatus Cloacimonadota bacterium]